MKITITRDVDIYEGKGFESKDTIYPHLTTEVKSL